MFKVEDHKWGVGRNEEAKQQPISVSLLLEQYHGLNKVDPLYYPCFDLFEKCHKKLSDPEISGEEKQLLFLMSLDLINLLLSINSFKLSDQLRTAKLALEASGHKFTNEVVDKVDENRGKIQAELFLQQMQELAALLSGEMSFALGSSVRGFTIEDQKEEADELSNTVNQIFENSRLKLRAALYNARELASELANQSESRPAKLTDRQDASVDPDNTTKGSEEIERMVRQIADVFQLPTWVVQRLRPVAGQTLEQRKDWVDSINSSFDQQQEKMLSELDQKEQYLLNLIEKLKTSPMEKHFGQIKRADGLSNKPGDSRTHLLLVALHYAENALRMHDLARRKGDRSIEPLADFEVEELNKLLIQIHRQLDEKLSGLHFNTQVLELATHIQGNDIQNTKSVVERVLKSVDSQTISELGYEKMLELLRLLITPEAILSQKIETIINLLIEMLIKELVNRALSQLDKDKVGLIEFSKRKLFRSRVLDLRYFLYILEKIGSTELKKEMHAQIIKHATENMSDSGRKVAFGSILDWT